MHTNIDFWEKILLDPSPVYRKLFEAEEKYLQTHITPNSKVLEIGCGNGRNIKTILEITENVVGLDNDPQAVKDAQKNLVDFPRMKIVLGEATNLPFPAESFDFVILLDTLVNFGSDKSVALKEMSRVLNKTGQMIVSVYSDDAFGNRLEMYKQIDLPIERIDGTTVFVAQVAGGHRSEQFSQKELLDLSRETGLKIVDCQKVEGIAYILQLVKT